MKGRTYRYMNNPLFQFGYGMSYTTFSVGTAQLNNITIRNGESMELTIPVTNTGKRSGTEVIQVYVRNTIDTTGLLKTLKGFKKVELTAGQKGIATIRLPYSAFEFYDETKHQLAVIPGAYEIWYGTSSADKDLKMIKTTVQ